MKQEVKILSGIREIFLTYENGINKDIFKYFYDLLNLKKEYLTQIMDECNVPNQVIISFLNNKHKEDVQGEYIVNSHETRKQITQIFLYPNVFNEIWNKNNILPVMLEFIHTFIHEIVHHRYLNERKASKRARECVASIFPELLEDLSTILTLDTTGHLPA